MAVRNIRNAFFRLFGYHDRTTADFEKLSNLWGKAEAYKKAGCTGVKYTPTFSMMAIRRSKTAPLLLEEYDRKKGGLTRARTEDGIHASALCRGATIDMTPSHLGRPNEREDPFYLAGFFPPTSFGVERRWTEDEGYSSLSESDTDDVPPTPEDSIATEGALAGKVMRWLVGLLVV